MSGAKCVRKSCNFRIASVNGRSSRWRCGNCKQAARAKVCCRRCWRIAPRSGRVDNVVFDTSAWLALAEGEAGADEVERQVAAAWLGTVSLHASFVSLTELQYIRTNEADADSADRLITWVKQQPVRWLHSDEALCGAAAKLKAAHK